MGGASSRDDRESTILDVEDLLLQDDKNSVVVLGAGPTGATAAIALAERCKPYMLDILVLDRRISKGHDGNFHFTGSRRRHQVVTLQEQVVQRVWSPATRQAMLPGEVECMWPDSCQVSLRELEDHGMARMQSPEFAPHIRLGRGSLSRDAFHELRRRQNTAIIIAEGGASTTSAYMFEDTEDKGICRPQGIDENAAGLYFETEYPLPPAAAADAVVKTLVQTVFLGNFSCSTGRGFINVRLTKEESRLLCTQDKKPATFGNPAYVPGHLPDSQDGSLLFDGDLFLGIRHNPDTVPEQHLDNALLTTLKAAARYYGIPWECVQLVVGIKLQPCALMSAVRLDREYPVLIAGDAAFRVHFWPGRGANSAIQTAIKAVQVIIGALKRDSDNLHLAYTDKLAYNNYVHELSTIEVGTRSRFSRLPSKADVKKAGLTDDRAKEILLERAQERLAGLSRRYEEYNQAFTPSLERLERSFQRLPSKQAQRMALSDVWPNQSWVSPVAHLPPRWEEEITGDAVQT